MNGIKTLNKRYQTIAWGAILVLLGTLGFIPGEQDDIFVSGIGIVLLGLNLARYLSKIPVSGFSITLGAVALIVGALILLRPVLGWDFHLELPVFSLMMLVIGLYLLIPIPKRVENS